MLFPHAFEELWSFSVVVAWQGVYYQKGECGTQCCDEFYVSAAFQKELVNQINFVCKQRNYKAVTDVSF